MGPGELYSIFRMEEQMGKLTLTNARLIDGTGSQPRDGMTVVLDNGRISEVRHEPAQSGSTAAPDLPDNLTEQEQLLMNLRYGLGGGSALSLHQTANRLGITEQEA